MRLVARWLIAAMLAVATAFSAHAWVPPTEVALAASALIMRGTDIGYQPTDEEYIEYAQGVIEGTAGLPDGSALQLLDVPGEFWPVTGLGDLTFDQSVAVGHDMLTDQVKSRLANGEDVIVFGHSQSAVIASKEKQRLLEEGGVDPGDVTFVLTANPNRPNGGLLARFPGLHIPLLDVTFNGPTPTEGPYETYDVAREYDGWADFPAYPLNLVSTANAILGIYYLHGGYYDEIDPNELDDPDYAQKDEFGDTTYYLVYTEQLPLLRPLRDLGIPDSFVDAIEPFVRRIVDLGYDRETSYGVHTPARLFPPLNPPEQEPEPPAEPEPESESKPKPVEAPVTKVTATSTPTSKSNPKPTVEAKAASKARAVPTVEAEPEAGSEAESESEPTSEPEPTQTSREKPAVRGPIDMGSSTLENASPRSKVGSAPEPSTATEAGVPGATTGDSTTADTTAASRRESASKPADLGSSASARAGKQDGKKTDKPSD